MFLCSVLVEMSVVSKNKDRYKHEKIKMVIPGDAGQEVDIAFYFRDSYDFHGVRDSYFRTQP